MERRTALSRIGSVALAGGAVGLAGCLGDLSAIGAGGGGETTNSGKGGQHTSQPSNSPTDSAPTKLGPSAYIEPGAYDRNELQFSETMLLNARDVAVQLEGTLRNTAGTSFDRVMFDVAFLYGPLGTETLWQTKTGFTNFPAGESIDFQIQYRGEDPPTDAMTALIRDIDTVEDR